MTDDSRMRLREGLLAQGEPEPSARLQYHKETEIMLQDMERRLRREKVGMSVMWIYAVLLTTAFLLMYGYLGGDGKTVALASSFMLLICAAVEVVKHFVNRSRVDVLREIKSLELRLFEEPRSAAVEKPTNSP
jgi:hypothetical protein